MQQPNYSVSVVIPTFNGRRLLEKHLPAVLKACNNCEVIVVDDVSSDDTREWLKTNAPEVSLVTLKSNLRFARACNLGVKRARGELILLLNNDVSPEPDFLQPLVSHFTNPKVFAVGCLEIDSNGEAESGRSEAVFERGIIRHFKSRDQSQQETLWVSGGSGMFRKEMWELLGGFDPLFSPAYDEDRDLCYRALKRGYLVEFEPKSKVEHNHESTNRKAFGAYGLECTKHKNALLVIWKNVTSANYLQQHLLWLSYHLLVTTLKTKGAFLIGFLMALRHLPQIAVFRREERKVVVVQDEGLIPLA